MVKKGGLRVGYWLGIGLLMSILAGSVSEARALSIDLGTVSSASGAVTLDNGLFNFMPNLPDVYSFTLTDQAHLAGHFTFAAVNAFGFYAMSVTLTEGPNTRAQTVASGDHTELGFPFPIPTPVAGVPGLLSLNLAPGSYQLTLKDGFGSYTGTLTFAAPVATTPIPPALPLFAGALGGLAIVGWRRSGYFLPRR